MKDRVFAMTDEDTMQAYVNSLTVDEARTVYGLIGKRLNAIMQVQEIAALQQYAIGERVAFHSNARHIEGLVVRINLRTVSVVENTGKRWTVSPQHLQKVPVDQSTYSPSETVKLHFANATPKKRKSKTKKTKKRRGSH